MVRLLFVRHGQSMSNVGRTFTGQADVPLSPLGKKQAEDLAAYLLAHERIDAVCSSDLRRARETVAPVAAALGLDVRCDARLREIFGGAWEEKTVEEIMRLYPEDYAVWRDNIGLARCTGGESFAEVQRRGLDVVGQIVREHPGETVLVGTHAAFLRAMQCVWMHLPLTRMKEISFVPNASTTEVVWEKGDYRFVGVRQDYLAGEVTRISPGF